MVQGPPPPATAPPESSVTKLDPRPAPTPPESSVTKLARRPARAPPESSVTKLDPTAGWLILVLGVTDSRPLNLVGCDFGTGGAHTAPDKASRVSSLTIREGRPRGGDLNRH